MCSWTSEATLRLDSAHQKGILALQYRVKKGLDKDLSHAVIRSNAVAVGILSLGGMALSAYELSFRGFGFSSLFLLIAAVNAFNPKCASYWSQDPAYSKYEIERAEKTLLSRVCHVAIEPKYFTELIRTSPMCVDGFIPKPSATQFSSSAVSTIFKIYYYFCASKAYEMAQEEPSGVSEAVHKKWKARFCSFKLMTAAFMGYSVMPYRYKASLEPLYLGAVFNHILNGDPLALQDLGNPIPKSLSHDTLLENSILQIARKLFPSTQQKRNM